MKVWLSPNSVIVFRGVIIYHTFAHNSLPLHQPMKAAYHLFLLVFIALAGCASTGTHGSKGTFRPTEIPKETPPPQVIIKPDTPQYIAPKKKFIKNVAPFKVTLLLPFNLTKGDDYKMDASIADYYEGVLMGLDSLKKLGIDIIVNAYDTKYDTATVRKLTWKKELEESNVIIGPTFKAGHAMLSKYVARRKIALISPFSNANMWSDSNYYSMYCTPDDKSYAARLAGYIMHRYPNANILLFNDNTKEDKDFLWRFKLAARDTGLTQWKDITYSSGGWDITGHLKKEVGVVNVIIAPTDNEAIANKLLTQLKDPEQVNTLFVLESWLDFKNPTYQTYQLWEQNNLHALTNYFVEDRDKNVMHFKGVYKERFGALPSDFSFRGYDQIISLGTIHYNAETAVLAENAEGMECEGLHNNFKFRFNGRALENRSVNIIEFIDHRFRRVKE